MAGSRSCLRRGDQRRLPKQQPGRGLGALAHGIRNENKEEFEKREKMCHLKRKEKPKKFLKRRLHEQYCIFCCYYPDFAAVSAINTVVAGRSGGGGSFFHPLLGAFKNHTRGGLFSPERWELPHQLLYLFSFFLHHPPREDAPKNFL